MAQRNKTRPSKRKRLALRAPSLPQASASGAAGIGKTQSFPVPGEATRFFDGFSRRDALAVLALGLLAGVCYLPAMLWGGFVWDDHIWSQSRAVLEWSGLSTIWSWPSRIYQEAHYWPLTYTTFWLEHKIWGLAPAGYHVVNVLLHLLNSLLVWRLLLRLGVPGAWVVAAVFAVHPLHVESVAWIIERKDVLSGLFYLAAVLVWLRFLEQPRPWRYGLALLLFVAGLLSKSIVVTLPAALLILQWWKEGRITVRDLRRLAPFFLTALLITAVDLSSVGSRHAFLDYSLAERMLVASRALWFYAGKLVCPTDLAVIYRRWDIGLGDPWAWLYLAGAAALAATAVVHAPQDWARAAGRGVVLCGDAVAGAELRESRLHDLLPGGRPLSIPGRHRGDSRPHRRCRARGQPAVGGLKSGATGLLVVVLALLGTTTWRQAEIYRDTVTLFSHIVSLNPKARNAHIYLSSALTRAGRPEEALAAARMAVEKRPDHANAYATLGALLIRTERFIEAEEILGPRPGDRSEPQRKSP